MIFPIETGVLDNFFMDTCWKAAHSPAHFSASATGEAPAAECYLDLETTGSNKIHQCISVYVLYTVYI